MTLVGQLEPATLTSDAPVALGDIVIIIILIMIGLQVAVNTATSSCGHIVFVHDLAFYSLVCRMAKGVVRRRFGGTQILPR